MHTVVVLAGGFLLLGLCVLAARLLGTATGPATAKAALAFIPLWLGAALLNMWIGVARAGYSVAAELPIFLIVFAVPAAAALYVWQRFAGTS
jgi:hypothetical protein